MSIPNNPSLELYTTILRVRDLDHSLDWYGNVFGLKTINRDSSYRLVTLAGENGQRITLRELKSGTDIVLSGLNGTYVVFMSQDAAEDYDRMQKLGLNLSPMQDLPGVRLFWVFDPDGHPLCILQFVIEWER